MKKITIEAEKTDHNRPNEWRLKFIIDDEPPIQEMISTSSNLPEEIRNRLVALFAKSGSS
jgi:hypothetical protein